MSLFNVDAEGKRIETDILVTGYIRDSSKEYKILIPEDISKICFVFWFITVTDEWDRQYLAEGVEINEQTAHLKISNMVSIYGSLGVDKIYSWKLRLITDTKWINIGIIEDNPSVLL